ncbi:MAG: glycosyltransferase family 1 protein [Victivallales bacterium]|jgi:zeaxanthin glucosyltransferase|nr:glycosyltransferase family 1 protein [Victivallales bacterium]MBT7300485.1 glycosyltransferase family 1 protein [Victivallales bacterium]
MAHFAILCPEAGGHLFPMGSLGLELRSRGHTVTVMALAKAAPIVAQLGLPLHELPKEARRLFRRCPWPVWLAQRVLGLRSAFRLRRTFVWRAACLLEYAPAALRQLGVDALLVDQGMLAASTVAERLGLPCISVCSALHWLGEPDVPPQFTGWPMATGRCSRWRNRVGYAFWHWYMRPAMQLINRQREEWRLAPLSCIDGAYSPLATLAQSCRAFDYPRACLPDTFHYVGALGIDRHCDTSAFPWDRLDGRPLIYASMGTVSPNQKPATFGRIAEACCGLDAQLIISTGKWERADRHEESGPLVLPGDPLVLSFVPQPALLEKAHLLITHAGQNTVAEALTRGVPMVALPQGADQFAMAARVERAGAGLRASSRRPSAQELRQLVGRVFSEESFRQRAGKLRADMLATGGVRRAADIAQEACETRQPVLRNGAPCLGGEECPVPGRAQ